MNKLGVLGASALLTLGLGGVTYSTWSDTVNQSSGIVQSGDLDISLIDGVTWTDSDNKVIDARTYRASAGESFTIDQKFKSKLDGENILGKLSTNWSKPDSLKDSTATYSILDSNGNEIVKDKKLGDSSVINDMGAGSKNYTFRINLKISDDAMVKWVSLPTDNSSAGSIDVGSIKLDLDQVRSGSGYK